MTSSKISARALLLLRRCRDHPGPLAVMVGGLRYHGSRWAQHRCRGRGRLLGFGSQSDGHGALRQARFLILPDRCHRRCVGRRDRQGGPGQPRRQGAGDDLQLISRLVSDAMSPPLVVGGHTAAQAVAEAMTLEGATAALVTVGDRLGIVTDRGFRARVVRGVRDSSGPVPRYRHVSGHDDLFRRPSVDHAGGDGRPRDQTPSRPDRWATGGDAGRQ